MDRLLKRYEEAKKRMLGILNTPTTTYTPSWVEADFEDLQIDFDDAVNEINNIFREMKALPRS